MPNDFRAHTAKKIPIKRGKYVRVLNTGAKIKNCVLINKYLILFLGQPKKQAFYIHSNPILLKYIGEQISRIGSQLSVDRILTRRATKRYDFFHLFLFTAPWALPSARFRYLL